MDMMWYRRRGLIMVTPHIERVTGAIASFNSAYNKIPVKSLICNIEPIQEGEGDPSPENVRPISGRTGLSVTRCGKNLINFPDIVNKTITNFYFESVKIDFVLKPNVTYTFSADAESTLEPFNSSVGCGTSRAYLTDLGNKGANNNGRISITFTPTEAQMARGNVLWVRFVRYTANRTFTYSIKNMQLEFGSTATDYEPYKGSTYSVNWETEAGTVYGGMLDAVSGKLMVDRAYIASYNGETLPSTWISDRDVYAVGTAPTTGAQVVYKLADPVEYQLTPQEVRTLLGENNIWCDSVNVFVNYWKWGK